MFKLNFSIYFKKYLIVKKEKIKETRIDNKFNFVNSKLSERIRFLKPKIETAPKIGIEIRKEIFADSVLLKPSNLAAVIAIPDLLTPGIKDKICINPIKRTDL